MLTKTTAIVLHKIPYTDHAAVVSFLTREHGLQRFLVQGLHRKNAKNAYYLPGNSVEIIYNFKSTGGLNRIKEIAISSTNATIPDFSLQQIKFFYLELISLCTTEGQTDVELFDFINTSLLQLNNEIANSQFLPIKFLLGLGEHLGYSVDWTLGTEKSLDLISGMLSDWSTPSHMKSEPWINKSIVQIQMGQIPTINRSERRMIIDKLLSQLQYHLFPGKSLKTLEIFDAMTMG